MEKVEVGPADWNVGEKLFGLEQYMWRKRAIVCSKFLNSNDHSVLDVGAGNMYLKKLLDENVIYYPLDYTKRQEDTIVCDLNKYEFPDIKVDAIVCAGIIGYLNDLNWFFDCLKNSTDKIILTYQSKECGFSQSLYTTNEIINMLYERGFVITNWDKEFCEDWPLLACFEKLTPHLLRHNYYCTGCGACSNKCPVDAIELLPDQQGFLKPKINNEKCIKCNQCVEVCPSAKPREMNEYAADSCQAYAAWATDEIRKDSSSGGAFTIMAENIFKSNGVVYGARYTEDFHIEHCGAKESSGLKELRHSKYVQSNTGNTFQEVKQQVEKGVRVLYVGTPCQIAGLKSYLGQDYECLLTIDVVCFCVTPVTAFRKYLEECYGIDDIANAVFRDKYRGWGPDAYTIHKKDGTILYLNIQTDYYQKAFHGVLCRNKTCDDCRYACFPRQGDITMGDFWGIDQHDPSWNDHKGTSLLIANTAKAKAFIEGIKDDFNRIEQVPVEWCRGKGNRIGHDGRGRHRAADQFMELIQDNGFVESVDRILENKHNIGLLINEKQDFGNYLMNYAFYQYLNDIGYSVLVLDQNKESEQKICDRKQSLFAHIPFAMQDVLFDMENKVKQKEANDACDMFVSFFDYIEQQKDEEKKHLSYLDWVGSDKYKMAYGFPVASEYIESEHQVNKQMQYFLKRFQARSVEDEKDIAYGINPVFLCNKIYYENMAKYGKLRLPEKQYVGVYLSHIEKVNREILHKVNKLEENTMQIICGTSIDENEAKDSLGLEVLTKPLVEEWLANIAYSKLYLTDSYYGVCFALIFHKDFYVLNKKTNKPEQRKILNLLKKIGLENRMLDETIEITSELFNEKIDFDVIEQSIKLMIQKSKQWIEEHLTCGVQYSGELHTYDILKEHFRMSLANVTESNIQMEIAVNNNKEKIDENSNKIQELRNEINQLQVMHRVLQEKYEAEALQKMDMSHKLAQVVQEKDQVITELNQVYCSKSWKLTKIWRKPLEYVRKIMKHH
ncbi:Coenzyme F420 hydrogenase/dehydrogenase, beta subunit C-terminal domain [Anaerosporobacter faecicola]|uniref:Coenzyme F420 hydrogenase/dehydrogenase, beta subunit C-terminal domain n=1 Tax=Anaerosporobacter faecicola TaxID=2718714 RepID=UPI00143A4C2A|nr:Coenzyme F420 hydrogenase/dehydrogenase, beta subunit C-terminal domain [Anaerosporobacter faecicola]